MLLLILVLEQYSLNWNYLNTFPRILALSFLHTSVFCSDPFLVSFHTKWFSVHYSEILFAHHIPTVELFIKWNTHKKRVKDRNRHAHNRDIACVAWAAILRSCAACLLLSILSFELILHQFSRLIKNQIVIIYCEWGSSIKINKLFNIDTTKVSQTVKSVHYKAHTIVHTQLTPFECDFIFIF